MIKSLIYCEEINNSHIDEGWLDWSNAEDNKLIFNRHTHKYTRENLLMYLQEIKEKNDLMYAVRLTDSNEYIGNIRLNDIDHNHKHCGYGRLLGNKNQRGKLYGQLMLYKICEIAFYELKMNKIFSPCFADNFRSMNSNLQFGMKISGYFSEHFIKDNSYKDVYYLELTKKDFERNIKKKFI